MLLARLSLGLALRTTLVVAVGFRRFGTCSNLLEVVFVLSEQLWVALSGVLCCVSTEPLLVSLCILDEV